MKTRFKVPLVLLSLCALTALLAAHYDNNSNSFWSRDYYAYCQNIAYDCRAEIENAIWNSKVADRYSLVSFIFGLISIPTLIASFSTKD